jgi:hypothetical protein
VHITDVNTRLICRPFVKLCLQSSPDAIELIKLLLFPEEGTFRESDKTSTTFPFIVDVNKVEEFDGEQETALINAAAVNNERAVELLLRAGAGVDLESTNPLSPLASNPLQAGIFFGSLEATRLLLAHGAAMSVDDDYFQKLQLGLRKIPRETLCVITAVLDAGADVSYGFVAAHENQVLAQQFEADDSFDW